MLAGGVAPALADAASVVTVQRTPSVPSAAALASPTSLFVECPSGYVAVSGGLDSASNDPEVVRLAPTFSANGENLMTAPAGTQSAPTGWMAAVRNLNAAVSRPATVWRRQRSAHSEHPEGTGDGSTRGIVSAWTPWLANARAYRCPLRRASRIAATKATADSAESSSRTRIDPCGEACGAASAANATGAAARAAKDGAARRPSRLP